MVIHQLELQKRGKNEQDDERVVHVLRNRMSLREGLGVDEELLESYRRQAEALFQTKKWRACADVVEGLVMLDAANTKEAMLLIRSYQELGEHERAAAVEAVVGPVLADMETRAEMAGVSR